MVPYIAPTTLLSPSPFELSVKWGGVAPGAVSAVGQMDCQDWMIFFFTIYNSNVILLVVDWLRGTGSCLPL